MWPTLTSRLRCTRRNPASRHCSSSARERHPDEVRAGVGVQPRVVAVRLDVPHVRAVDEPRDAAELDRDRLAVGLRRRWRVGRDPPDCLGQPVRVDRLEQVVGGLELERVDRVVVVRGDEHHAAAGRAAGAISSASARPSVPGHPDVEEHHVGRLGVQRCERLAGRRRGPDRADPGVLTEQVAELLERRRLVVHHEDVQAAARHGRSVRGKIAAG